MLKADGFDEAILGVWEDPWSDAPKRVVYSTTKCVDILARDMPAEEAVEYFGFNVVGSYVGECTPIFIDDYDDEQR